MTLPMRHVIGQWGKEKRLRTQLGTHMPRHTRREKKGQLKAELPLNNTDRTFCCSTGARAIRA
jgi:hypothetical protein